MELHADVLDLLCELFQSRYADRDSYAHWYGFARFRRPTVSATSVLDVPTILNNPTETRLLCTICISFLTSNPPLSSDELGSTTT